jgi:hypothetical protein
MIRVDDPVRKLFFSTDFDALCTSRLKGISDCPRIRQSRFITQYGDAFCSCYTLLIKSDMIIYSVNMIDPPKTFPSRLSASLKPTNIGRISLWLSIVLIAVTLLAIAFSRHPFDAGLGLMYFIHELPWLPFFILLFSLIGVVLGFIGTVQNRSRIQAFIGMFICAILFYMSIKTVFSFFVIYLVGHSGTP